MLSRRCCSSPPVPPHLEVRRPVTSAPRASSSRSGFLWPRILPPPTSGTTRGQPRVGGVPAMFASCFRPLAPVGDLGPPVSACVCISKDNLLLSDVLREVLAVGSACQPEKATQRKYSLNTRSWKIEGRLGSPTAGCSAFPAALFSLWDPPLVMARIP